MFRVFILLSVFRPTDRPTDGRQLKASSESLTVCQSALTVTGQPPDSWYKDEGGKNNCIDIAVQVCLVSTYIHASLCQKDNCV